MNFDKAVEYVNNNKEMSESMSSEDVLFLYGLYKQSIVGDNDKECPSIFNYRERKKWEAWYENKGIKKEVAKKLYCRTVEKLKLS